MKNKKIIEDCLGELQIKNLNKNFSDLISFFEKDFKSFLNKKYSLYNDSITDYTIYFDFKLNDLFIYGLRYETNKEYNERLKKEEISYELKKLAAKARKEIVEKEEKELYEKLKLKYEKNN